MLPLYLRVYNVETLYLCCGHYCQVSVMSTYLFVACLPKANQSPFCAQLSW